MNRYGMVAMTGGDRDAQRQRAAAAAAAEARGLHGEEPPGRLRATMGSHAPPLGHPVRLFLRSTTVYRCVCVHLLRLLADVLGGRIHRTLLRRGYLHW